jgi:amidase
MIDMSSRPQGVVHRCHAFGADALGDHDAVALAQQVKRGDVSTHELVQAAQARLARVNPHLNAVQSLAETPVQGASLAGGVFAGVPSWVKDNTALAGMPTGHGSRAVPTQPAAQHGAFAQQFLAQGLVVLGKTKLPEFGFNASTEFMHDAPTCNPWRTDYSCGGSSGGSAALVAAGVVPIAHANDGGGSIRIPASACGLIGLKTTRGRLVTGEMAQALPLNIISDGVVTRSVRDTAHFLAGAERYWRNPTLPPLGLVEQPLKRRLRIGLIVDSITGQPTCAETRATVEHTATLLQQQGHHIERIAVPAGAVFVEDFTDYWAFLAFMIRRNGKRGFGEGFDPAALDLLTQGLDRRFKRRGLTLPMVLYRLHRTWHEHATLMQTYDVLLSPVLGRVPAPLGFLKPDQPFEVIMERLRHFVSFTPLNNANGSPAISLPMGMSQTGIPIGVQFAAAHGDERTLLELAFELEQIQPWRRIQDPC